MWGPAGSRGAGEAVCQQAPQHVLDPPHSAEGEAHADTDDDGTRSGIDAERLGPRARVGLNR